MHKNLLRRLLKIGLIVGSANAICYAQTTPQEKKIDLSARKALKLMNENKPDSVYAMTGQAFRSQISVEVWNNLYESQVSQILPFTDATFIKSDNGVNEYKLKAGMELSYFVSLDEQNKLKTFLFKPYQAPAPSATKTAPQKK